MYFFVGEQTLEFVVQLWTSQVVTGYQLAKSYKINEATGILWEYHMEGRIICFNIWPVLPCGGTCHTILWLHAMDIYCLRDFLSRGSIYEN